MVACSSVEVEFKAMQGIFELFWLQIILIDLTIKVKTPMMLNHN